MKTCELAETPFSTKYALYLFGFTAMDDLECPDCGGNFKPENLGEAVDWAIGHPCPAPWEVAP